MKKRVLSMLLAGIMAVSALAGCAAKPANDTSNGSADTAVEIDTSEEVTLKLLLLSQKSTDWEPVWDEVNKYLKEKINATFDVTFIPWADYINEYSLILSSGEKYDLMYTSDWCLYPQSVAKEGFIELTDDLLSTYAPQTYAKVKDSEWAAVAIGGKQYMIPFTSPMTHNGFCALIRGDLIEKYNIPEVKDMESFMVYLETIAAQDGEMVAYNTGMTDQAMMISNALTNAQGLYPAMNITTGLYVDIPASEETGSLVIRDVLEDEELMGVYDTLSDLRQKGVWSQDLLSNQSLVEQQFENGNSASFVKTTTNITGYYTKLNALHPEWKLQVVDLREDGPNYLCSPQNQGFAIPVSSENPERALMALDLLRYDQYLNDLTIMGIEGTHWTAVGTDQYATTDKSADYPFGDATFSWGWHTDITRTLAGYPDYLQAILDDIANTGYAPFFLTFTFDVSSVNSEYAAVSAVVSEYSPILNGGLAEDPMATFAEFREKLNQAGFETLMNAYTEQLEAHLKENLK